MGSLSKLSNEALERLPIRRSSTADRVQSKGKRSLDKGRRSLKALGSAARSAAERARRSDRRQRWRKRAGIVAAGTATGAGAYFLDPNSGKRRRHLVRDRIAALIRRGGRQAERAGSYGAHTIAGKAKGAAAAAQPTVTPSDEALADRVRSEVFRPADAPKGAVNVNVVDGVVYLRGEVDQPDEIKSLVRTTESVDGVERVENLLHTPA